MSFSHLPPSRLFHKGSGSQWQGATLQTNGTEVVRGRSDAAGLGVLAGAFW
jgi:hypothetical protein